MCPGDGAAGLVPNSPERNGRSAAACRTELSDCEDSHGSITGSSGAVTGAPGRGPPAGRTRRCARWAGRGLSSTAFMAVALWVALRAARSAHRADGDVVAPVEVPRAAVGADALPRVRQD